MIQSKLAWLARVWMGRQVIYEHPVCMWCDNTAAVLAASDATSIKRLAYIARRCRFLQELVASKVIKLLNVPGNVNPADAFTKHISPKQTFKDYMSRVYQVAASFF